MSVAYQSAQKQRVRITLDLNVLDDFNARDIDFEKLFQLEPNENVEVYIEEFDRYWQKHQISLLNKLIGTVQFLYWIQHISFPESINRRFTRWE